VVYRERRQTLAAQAIFIIPAQLISRSRSEFHLQTPAALKGRAAAERVSAGFAHAFRSFIGKNKSHQFAQHHHPPKSQIECSSHSCPRFQLQRQSRDNEDYLVGGLRQTLIGKALQIAKLASDRVLRHEATTDLIADDDHIT
jgi:hypothetical protein